MAPVPLILRVHGEEIDLSEWADEHPGGRMVLVHYANADATEAFESIGHSLHARHLLKQMKMPSAVKLVGSVACSVPTAESPSLFQSQHSKARIVPSENSSDMFELPVNRSSPWRIPLIGHTLLMNISNPHQTFLALCRKLRAVLLRVDFGLFRNPMVIVAEPQLARSVLLADNIHFVKGPGYSAITSVTPFHLLVTEGKLWAERQKEVESAVRELMGSHLPTLRTHASRFADSLLCECSSQSSKPGAKRGSRNKSLPEQMRAATLGLISEVTLGEALPPAETQALQRLMHEWHYRVTDIIPGWKLGWRGSAVRMAEQTVFTYFAARVAAMRRGEAPACLAAKCWLHLPDRHVCELIFTFIAMGHENVGSAISWTFALLCEHPSEQEAVAAEALRAPPMHESRQQHAADITHRPTPRLDAFVAEALRLYPPIPMLSRAAHGSVRGVQQAEELLINPYVLHRLPAVWPTPDKFDPSRWLQGATQMSGEQTAAYMPFGAGPRRCPGMAFAQHEMRAMVVATLQRARLAFDPHTQKQMPAERLFVSLRPAPFWVVLTEREEPPTY